MRSRLSLSSLPKSAEITGHSLVKPARSRINSASEPLNTADKNDPWEYYWAGFNSVWVNEKSVP